MKIIVSSLALVPGIIATERPSHVISLLAPEDIHLATFDHVAERHLRLEMHDLRESGSFNPGEIPPHEEHVARLLAFAGSWTSEAPILVHCWAGISRSTAAAFTLACARNPDIAERDIALALRAASATAWPNPVIVGHADAALGRGGRMLAAIDAIGEPEDFENTQPFHLPAIFAAPER
jgi:predicted protein tyrosine phosphatase